MIAAAAAFLSLWLLAFSASASGTPTGVVVDVATSPVLRESQVLNGASDFSTLLSRAYVPKSVADGAEFQRLLSQPVTNAGARAAAVDVAETVLLGIPKMGVRAAAMCFSNPTLCLAGAVVTYLAVNQWGYDTYTQQWKKPKAIGVGSCNYNGVTKTNYTKSQCDAYVESIAPSAKGTPGTAGYSYDGTEQLPNSTTPTMTNYWSHYHISNTPSIYNMGYYTPGGTSMQMAPGTQEEMAADVTAAGGTSVGSANPGNAALAQQLIANSQPLPIEGTDTASLSMKAATATATSSQTNPDGTTTTITETYTATPSSGPISNTQIVFNTTTTTVGPTNTFTTSTTNTTNITNINNNSSGSGGPSCGAPGMPDCNVKVDETASDTPLPDQPHLYDQKYPNGMLGVWQARGPALMNSQFMQSVQNMFQTGSTGGGTCPSFIIPLDFGPKLGNFGNGDVSPPCWLWPVIALIFLTTAVFVARQIVWG